ALGYREHWEVLRKRAPGGGIDPSLSVVVPPRRETAPYPLALITSLVVGQSRGVKSRLVLWTAQRIRIQQIDGAFLAARGDQIVLCARKPHGARGRKIQIEY